MKNKSMRLLLASAVTVLGLSGFTSCDNEEDTEVAIADLVDTGTNGYKINILIDEELSIDYYFCTNLDAFESNDYAAWDSSEVPFDSRPWDYGGLDYEGPWLGFFSMIGDSYEIDTDGPTPGYLQEGQTYFYEFFDVGGGIMHINSISSFDCTSIDIPT